ncbi:MAG: hypothetical protein HC821_05755 [Lewinella sp.]|nr:hypothetical protein [Lewinella sp.]
MKTLQRQPWVQQARYLRQFVCNCWEGWQTRVYFINFWFHWGGRDVWFYQFLQRPDLAPMMKRQRIAFFSVFGPRSFVRLIRTRGKIFFTGENLANFPHYTDYLQNQVGLALGFAQTEAFAHYLRFHFGLPTSSTLWQTSPPFVAS